MLIVCAGLGLFLINALDTPTPMILSGAPAYFVNEANLLDAIFLLYLKGPLIKGGPLGLQCQCVGALGRALGRLQEQRAARVRPVAGRAVFGVRM